MNLHIVAGVVLIGFGVVYGIVSLRQVVNGTGFWIRQPKVAPYMELRRAGGWVGVGLAAIAVLLGVDQLDPQRHLHLSVRRSCSSSGSEACTA